MVRKIKIEDYDCRCVACNQSGTIIYMIYPAVAELDDEWLEKMSVRLNSSLAAVYVPADKWNDVLTPWPEPGEAKGCPPFAGKSQKFLNLLTSTIIPGIEKDSGLNQITTRDLAGVSLGGLFTLWQWLVCDTFHSIACLSGSFWYEGFIEWFESRAIPEKNGKAYFLLGDEEPKSKVKAFQSVGVNTEKIVTLLKQKGIQVEFEWVPGNHFSRPVHRAEKALENIL